MKDKYFTCKKLTEKLYLNLPEGALFAITDSSKTLMQIGEMGAMKHRKGDWDCWYAERVGEICHCFKGWDEYEKWAKEFPIKILTTSLH
jgi:hypothetical protein